MIPRRYYHIAPGELRLLARHHRAVEPADQAVLEQFESEFSRRLGGAHSVSFDLGRHALLALLEALRIEPGQQVLLPACSFIGLRTLLRDAGFKVDFLDLPSPGWNSVKSKRLFQVSAVIPVYLFGYPTDWSAVFEDCKEQGIQIIEDCAHGPGILWNGKPVGSIGDAAFFSFNALKPINAYVGGMAVIRQDEAGKRLAQMSHEEHQPLSDVLTAVAQTRFQNALLGSPLYEPVARLFGNPLSSSLLALLNDWLFREKQGRRSRLHPALAAVALLKMKDLEDRVATRLAIARRYDQALSTECRFHDSQSDNRASGYFYIVKSVQESQRVRQLFLSHGIDVGIGSEVVDFLPDPRRFHEFPVAWDTYKTAVQIPLHEHLSEPQVQHICAVLTQLALQGAIEHWFK